MHDGSIALLWALGCLVPYAGHLFELFALFVSALVEVRYVSARGSDREVRELRATMKRRAWAHSATCAGEPIGLSVGRWFAAHSREAMSDLGNVVTIWFCRFGGAPSGPAPDETAAEPGIAPPADTLLSTWERSGPFYNISWKKASRSVRIEHTPEQKRIVESICSLAAASEQNGFGFNASVLLTGPPGSGKSTVAALVALRLRGALCADHRPTETGDELAHLRTQANPDRVAPLVVLMDEWDATIRRVYSPDGEPFRFRDMRPQICDKSSYSAYMDRLESATNCVFIFTANSSPRELQALDTSCVRPGRINLFHEMTDVDGVAFRQARRFAS